MKIPITLFLFLFHIQLFAQSFKEVELKTSIEEVVVFLQNANILRTGKVSLPAGKSKLITKSLSPFLDANSIEVKGNGDFTILSVRHTFNYLDKLSKDAKVDSLHERLVFHNQEIKKRENRLQVLGEKRSLLNENKKLGGSMEGTTLADLKAAMEFYDKELSAITSEELNIQSTIRDLKEQQGNLEKQISDTRNAQTLPTSEIEVRVEAETSVEAEFVLTYLVSQAGWYPKYDVRVADIQKPVELNYKADVYQKTGVNWENVKLKFSNGNPTQSGTLPQLNPWRLNFVRYTRFDRSNSSSFIPTNSVSNVTGILLDENGSPLIGASVLVKGSSIGTLTDSEGRYAISLPDGAKSIVFSYVGYDTKEVPVSGSQMNVALDNGTNYLDEVVVTGYSSKPSQNRLKKRTEAQTIVTNTIENQTTVEFEITQPYSIKSDAEKLSVDLATYEIDALYSYYAVPKLDKDAFLMARITDWDQYNLLEGEANLYFEDTYVGRSILNAKVLTDTLDISLGRDKNILIGREKVKEYSERRTIGSHKIENRSFEIVVVNKKSHPIQLTLFDQIPLSVTNDIQVSTQNISNGSLDESTGKITWQIEVLPQTQKTLSLQYEIKYPKRENVVLE